LFSQAGCTLWQAVWFEGGYSEYEADYRRRSGGADPTRIKYRRMAVAA
jgi:sulfate-transporting ATPase